VLLAGDYGRPLIAFLESADEIPGLPDGIEARSSFEDVRRFVDLHLPALEPRSDP
jgi:hypothetical protein